MKEVLNEYDHQKNRVAPNNEKIAKVALALKTLENEADCSLNWFRILK